MELAHNQNNPPSRRSTSECRLQRLSEHQQAPGIECPQHRPDNDLRMLKASQPDQWLTDTRKDNGTKECSWYSSGEGEVVVHRGEAIRYVMRGRAIDKDVVDCLNVEGFFNFRMWREK